MKKNEKLFDGITGIKEEIILKAERYEFKKKKKAQNSKSQNSRSQNSQSQKNLFRKRKWWAAVAAIVAAAIGINAFSVPVRITAYAVALPDKPRITKHPDRDDYEDLEAWREASAQWDAEYEQRNDMAAQAAAALQPFCTEGNRQFLTSEDAANKIWAPINAYIGLAMTTELTSGESRQQVLDLFGAKDTDALREQVSAVWESVYRDKSQEICVLANSLWLEKELTYRQETMDAIAYHYYGSVYKGDLGSDRTNKDIAAWVNNNTGKFLKEDARNIQLSPETVMALYSTIYFQAKWSDEFSASKNTTDVFHAPDKDVQAVYMNKKLYQMDYFWGETFGAVSLGLKNGCYMWFILPDEGMTTQDVLADGSYMEMVMDEKWENRKYMKVNLSVPKFDVSSTMDLKKGLENMGVTNVFHEQTSDFTALTADIPIWLTSANQSARVQIDEKGVKAAAYIELPGNGSAMPPEEIIDFVLDRPFLFVISNGYLPLFAGCVNQPE